MGIPDGSVLDLIDKVRSWITLGASDLGYFSREFDMPVNSSEMCYKCDTDFNGLSHGYHCQSCGKWFCAKCIQCYEPPILNEPGNLEGSAKSTDGIGLCKACDGGFRMRQECASKCYEKVHPAASPRGSPEPPSPSFSGQGADGESPQGEALPSQMSFQFFHGRVQDEEAEDSGKQLLSPISDCGEERSDVDSNSLSARPEFCICKSSGSSPYDSPCRNTFSPHGRHVQEGQEGSLKDGPFHQEDMAVLKKPEPGNEDTENPGISLNREVKLQQPLDFENNGRIWYPPPPDDANDGLESNYFAYDDDDDDDAGDTAALSASSSLSTASPAKERPIEGTKEPLRAIVHGHFRALVAQLLLGEGIDPCRDNISENWLEIITNLAWQAAHFVKPDTSRGGSMDPGDYVKVKCTATGNPRESVLIRGVVCTKNIKHKRMTSQHKNPRLLLLGGALECQRIPNQLASFNTLLQQENDHLRMIIAKIEALRPNVLLVEKSASSYAQKYLLEKDISLVLNVKRPLLERIARCTGALVCPSIDNISASGMGRCELFRLEKVSEEHEAANQFNKKPSKTLMFFEGCPRRLGCTVLLRGSCRNELKKLKHVVQYAIFAAYHLSLETSFLADEGASLPRMRLKHTLAASEGTAVDSTQTDFHAENNSQPIIDASAQDYVTEDLVLEHEVSESLPECMESNQRRPSVSGKDQVGDENIGACNEDMADSVGLAHIEEPSVATAREYSQSKFQESVSQEENHAGETQEMKKYKRMDEDDVSSEYFSATDTHQSILVSFSSRCVLKETVCERSRLLRIKFYGSFDKPLGRYLHDDLFDQTSSCGACREHVDAHVLCYTHQHGNLTINVRRLPSMKLPGQQDGRIWMWHRCLRCAHVDGVPPAARRVVMSDAAWGLSFGKFLELSFSNHATANRVASCGHSLQRDCLRFYGFGEMVAFFRYSPIDILSVYLPPSVLEFNTHDQQGWLNKEAREIMSKMRKMYAEISDALDDIEEKITTFEKESSDSSEYQGIIMKLKDQLIKERHEYYALLQPAVMEALQPDQSALDILELNRLRGALIMGSFAWDRQLYSLNSLLKGRSTIKTQPNEFMNEIASNDGKFDSGDRENVLGNQEAQESPKKDLNQRNEDVKRNVEALPQDPVLISESQRANSESVHLDRELSGNETFAVDELSPASSLSERIDYAWTGTTHISTKESNSPLKRLVGPVRVHSFDSVLRIRERIQKGLPPSPLHFLTIRSFHASGDYKNMVRDPVSNVMRAYSQVLPLEIQKLNLVLSTTPTFVPSASRMAEGARLLVPQGLSNDIVIAVYDDDPASVISYAINSKEYRDWISDKFEHEDRSKDSFSSAFSALRPFGSMDLDYIQYGSYGSDDGSPSVASLFTDSKRSPHLTISFGDESSSAGGKVRFSVTCYFAKEFDDLRQKCCPIDADFIRSLSRCQRWSAQGGKSNVYFAKSLDERFIIKQVKKTELDSFGEFAPEYFKYLTHSLSSGSPTCLAKILGIFQVSIKHLKGGKETKIDLMVMENLFYKRSLSRIYDLKGSARSRYNPDTSGANKVLLDMNLLETLRTEPMFLGSKAKRIMERAIWNDTAFLASVDVMDYSLLVGVDEERKELVLGIIDFMRQYTWDKHLETWVKATGILGGLKNASPTIISPKQYKKRFRKAMKTYFLTVPDPWSS